MKPTTFEDCMDVFDWFDDALYEYLNHIWLSKLDADARIARLRLDDCLASCRALMTDDLPLHGAEGHLAGLLRWGLDIPELLRAYPGELLAFSGVDSRLRPTREEW